MYIWGHRTTGPGWLRHGTILLCNLLKFFKITHRSPPSLPTTVGSVSRLAGQMRTVPLPPGLRTKNANYSTSLLNQQSSLELWLKWRIAVIILIPCLVIIIIITIIITIITSKLNFNVSDPCNFPNTIQNSTLEGTFTVGS